MHAEVSVVLLTPAGRSAVASLLVEGPGATQAVSGLFQPVGRRLADVPCGRIVFGRWQASTPGEEVVVCRRADESIEIHCHGGRTAARAIIDSLAELGCREIAWRDWIHHSAADPLAAEAQVALATASTERTALVLWDQYEGALRRAVDKIAELVFSRQDTAAIESH